MITTLDVVNANQKPEPSAEETAAKDLVRLAREQGLSLTGPDGLLKQIVRAADDPLDVMLDQPDRIRYRSADARSC